MPEVIYKQANTRKCYWQCLGCLKGLPTCSLKCPGYLSIARSIPEVKNIKQKEEKNY